MTPSLFPSSLASRHRLLVACLIITSCLVFSCKSPLQHDDDLTGLRQRVMLQARQDLAGEPHDTQPSLDAPIAGPLLSAEHVQQLDQKTDPRLATDRQVDWGPSLDQAPPIAVNLSLDRAVSLAVKHNLDVSLARIIPEIRQTQVTEAQAEFDWNVFGNVQWSHTDLPQPASSLNGVSIGADSTVQDRADFESGIRKRLGFSGGTVSVSTGSGYLNERTPSLEYLPDPSYNAQVAVALTQPLLRDFGSTVTKARIRLAENATRREQLALIDQLLDVAAQAEQRYWDLVFAHHRLAIEEQLLEITLQTNREVVARGQVDANPVQIAQSHREVRLRQAEVLRARSDLRNATDQLKRLLNAPNIPLLGEAMVVPSDYPDELPDDSQLLASVEQAITHRPDLNSILVDMKDVKLQQQVALNQLLPRLDLTGRVANNSLSDAYGETLGDLGGPRTEYQVGVEFEHPIGNRGAKAAQKRTRLAEQATNVRYQSAVNDAVLQVKQAMREMRTAYQVLHIARQGRRAAAENLRTLLEREQTAQDLTPEFLLDLKLRTQQALANAQTDELRANISYGQAKARYYRATGILLDQRGLSIEADQDSDTPAENSP